MIERRNRREHGWRWTDTGYNSRLFHNVLHDVLDCARRVVCLLQYAGTIRRSTSTTRRLGGRISVAMHPSTAEMRRDVRGKLLSRRVYAVQFAVMRGCSPFVSTFGRERNLLWVRNEGGNSGEADMAWHYLHGGSF